MHLAGAYTLALGGRGGGRWRGHGGLHIPSPGLVTLCIYLFIWLFICIL